MQQKQQLLHAFKGGRSASIKYLAPRNMQYPDIDRQIWDFFCLAHPKNVPISGPMLKQEANEIALRLHHDTFTASNGWLGVFL